MAEIRRVNALCGAHPAFRQANGTIGYFVAPARLTVKMTAKNKTPDSMSKRALGLALAVAATLFLLDTGSADASAAARKHHQASHHKASAHHAAAHKATRHKSASRKKNGRKIAAKPMPPVVITIKAPNDAPDFDYSARIQQAQDLLARQPVQTGDMVVDRAGNLAQFTWVLAVGQRTGPLTVVRMDARGKK